VGGRAREALSRSGSSSRAFPAPAAPYDTLAPHCLSLSPSVSWLRLLVGSVEARPVSVEPGLPEVLEQRSSGPSSFGPTTKEKSLGNKLIPSGKSGSGKLDRPAERIYEGIGENSRPFLTKAGPGSGRLASLEKNLKIINLQICRLWSASLYIRTAASGPVKLFSASGHGFACQKYCPHASNPRRRTSHHPTVNYGQRVRNNCFFMRNLFAG
jgi:hypothetical protein